MNRILGLMLVAVLVFAAAPAFAGTASQMWKCELDDEVTEEQALAAAKQWLELAKKVEGGENLKGYVRFPVAVNATGEFDVFFEVVFPTFEEWGKFWDNYSDSEAGVQEDRNVEAGIVCPDSAVWEREAIK